MSVNQQEFETSVTLRRPDFDASGHVYHSHYLSVIDAARAQFLDDGILGQTPGTRYLVARMELDFLKMVMTGTSTVTVRIHTQRLGRSSIELLEEVLVGDEVCVRTTTTVVVWDLHSERTRPLTDTERGVLENYLV